jgi:hypothetical protein
MEGLFYCKTNDEKYTTVHLLKFYENSGYVIAKSVTGDNFHYFAKELKIFSMDGHIVKGEPEFTFCGAYNQTGDALSFKVENEISDSSDTWAQKDILSFKGSLNGPELHLTQISKRTKLEIQRIYFKGTEEEILKNI